MTGRVGTIFSWGRSFPEASKCNEAASKVDWLSREGLSEHREHGAEGSQGMARSAQGGGWVLGEEVQGASQGPDLGVP